MRRERVLIFSGSGVEFRREVSAVFLLAVKGIERFLEGMGFINVDDVILADVVHGVG